MKKYKTKFKGLFVIKSKVFFDDRGFFRETFRKKNLNKNLIFGCSSKSKKYVLRGLHLQNKNAQGKFISVIKGEIFDVAVDLRKNSSTFGKYFTIKLSERNGKSIFIPAGFAHGFVGLKKENIVYYFCTNYRSASHELGISWNDKDLKIKWPVKKPLVSKKDKKNISFKDYLKKFVK
tara:strand:+ start:400 stop:930 length:531 start_codon:yes stop_codon:yes gene_type:complete